MRDRPAAGEDPGGIPNNAAARCGTQCLYLLCETGKQHECTSEVSQAVQQQGEVANFITDTALISAHEIGKRLEQIGRVGRLVSTSCLNSLANCW